MSPACHSLISASEMWTSGRCAQVVAVAEFIHSRQQSRFGASKMNERQAQFLQFFPGIAELVEMEPEELGPFILRYMKKDGATLNRFNFFQSVPNNIAERMMEAWSWLEQEGFIALRPNDQFGLQYFVTRKGERIVSEEDFNANLQGALFPKDLDPILLRSVKPLFIRGDYDTAVFRAFKEVEVQVRAKAKFGNELFGRDLMIRAFGANGPLTDSSAPKGEQDAMRELFAGAISSCKNPSSHRQVQFENPREVMDLICFANQLLRIIRRIAQ
jgi:uncharacterized protein (TIGR02391 family)